MSKILPDIADTMAYFDLSDEKWDSLDKGFQTRLREQLWQHRQNENPTEPVTRSVKTKDGNTLQFFYNPQNNLVVVDLIAANDEGGNELVRLTLNEKKMLAHVK